MREILSNYPFEILDEKTIITKKEAKALIIKFLKREGCFKEMISECMIYHRFKTVDQVLNNMVNTTYLCDCLFYSDRIFPWDYAKIYHRANADKYWSKLRDKWWKKLNYPAKMTNIKRT